jgi:hypothetical protein
VRDPPTDDCTKASVLAIVKNHLVEVFLNESAPNVSGSAEPKVEEGEAEDATQEDTVKAGLLSVAATLAKKL